MNILSGLTDFVYSFKSENIVEGLIDTRNRMREGSQEVVKKCAEETATVDFSKNKDYIAALTFFKTNFYTNNVKNLFEGYGLFLQICDKHLDQMIGLTNKYFTATVDKDSLTYPRAQILAMAESIEFVSDYVSKHCRYLIAKQNELAGGTKVDKVVSRATIKYLVDNQVDFFNALNRISKIKAGDLEKTLKAIPDVKISEDGSEKKMFPAHALDPSGITSRFFSATYNPFYYWRMWRVDRAHEKYKLAKEEAESIKIELEAMSAQMNTGQVDAYLERQRDLAIERLNKLEYQIAKHEEQARNTKY